jgi:hypothetical protein
MTNADFKAYLERKLAACRNDIKEGKLPPEELKAARQAEEYLISSIQIMNNRPGQVARRYKRDYLRRLEKAGVPL